MKIEHFRSESAAWFDFALKPTDHEHELLIHLCPISGEWMISYKNRHTDFPSFRAAFKAVRKRYKWMRESK